MVRVFRGYDRDAGRPVTLKLLARESAQSLRERFQRDAGIAAKLREPCVGAVYEIGEHDGLLFVAMQCPEGERLDEVITKSAALTILEKAGIMWLVGKGLDTLQSAGIIAGVRPGDIIVGPNGAATIADFGALRLLPAEAERDDPYWSPEESAGGAPDFPSDVFSFGAIYFALLTGKTPSSAELASCDLVGQCPKALQAVIRQAVEKRPEVRYQRFSELQCDAAVILADLRRIHVAAALPEVRTMLERGELSRAHEELTELLQVDSGNRAANRLLAELRDRLHQQTTASRLASVNHAVEAAAAHGDWDGALELLRSAARVEPGNPELSRRLAAIEQRVDQARRYREAFLEGQQLASDGRFPEAKEVLLQALQIEPGGSEARELLEHVTAEFLAAQQLRVSHAIEEADVLISSDRPDLALEALRERAAHLPAGLGLESRIAELESALPAWNARHAVRDALARAAALEQLNELAAALRVVEETSASYPDSAELAAAMANLRSRYREQERRTRLERRLQSIRRLADAKDWAGVVGLLESSTLEFPEESGLKTELAHAREALRRSECERACAEAQRLMAEGEIDEARRALKEALTRAGNDAALAALLEEAERRAADDADWETAKALFGRRQFDEAEQILTRLAEGNHPRRLALLEMVRSARAIRAEEEFYADGRNRAVKLLEAGDYEGAAELLRNLLALFPDDPILLRRLATAEASSGRKIAPAEQEQAKEIAAAEPLVQNAPAQLSIPVRAASQLRRRRGRAIVTGIIALGAIAAFLVGRSHDGHPSAPPAPAARPQAFEAKSERVEPVVNSESAAVPNPPPVTPAKTLPVPKTAASRTKPTSAPRPFVPPATRSTAPPTRDVDLPSAAQISPQTQAPSTQWIANRVAPPPAPAQPSATSPAQLAAAPPARDPAYPATPAVRPAKALRAPPPLLPALALQRGIHGDVRLDATIAKDGTVKEVKVISGEPILVQAARQAVLKWHFQPATLNGASIESHSLVLVVFEGRK